MPKKSRRALERGELVDALLVHARVDLAARCRRPALGVLDSRREVVAALIPGWLIGLTPDSVTWNR